MKPVFVIKVGSAVLVKPDNTLNHIIIETLVENIIYARSKGFAVVLVSSGAVAAGNTLGKKLSKGTKAAIGQLQLMRRYRESFDRYGATISQYLITKEDVSDRKRYICLHACLEEAANNDIIPIINDNDVLHEARESFSDNDQLAAYISIMLDAEKLCILSSVDGIYHDFGTEKQKKIEKITALEELTKVDTSGKTDTGTGGMEGKIKSLTMVMKSGIVSCIANGKNGNAIRDVVDGVASSTHIYPLESSKRKKGIKKWLFAGANSKGSLLMSDMAASMIGGMDRKSVLAKGVVEVLGVFEKGDVVEILDMHKNILGYGVTRLSSSELETEKGKENITVIHADYCIGA